MNDTEVTQNNAQIIEQTLAEFDSTVKVIATDVGLRFTRYTVQLLNGVTVGHILRFETNLALNLRAVTIRISESPEDTTQACIEVSNGNVANISLDDLQAQAPTRSQTVTSLDFIVGEDVKGDLISADLAAMPNLMIAGETASGKSMMLNNILVNILTGRTPEDLRIILIDPKQVEFHRYAGIPHLLRPVATRPAEWIDALRWAEQEVFCRIKLLTDSNSQSLEDYNLSADDPLPQIVIMTEEFSDMMMVDSSEIERLISAITPHGVSTGVHLIVSTSRPSADVYSDSIKKCFDTRMVFAVPTKTDSIAMLGDSGAEKLLGRGDMLFKRDSEAHAIRLQGAYVSREFIEHTLQKIIAT